MTHLTREQILNRKLGRETVELHDGSTVLVRGLVRSEGEKVQQAPEGAGRDAVMFHHGVLEPAMSAEDWLAAFDVLGVGDSNAIAGTIGRLSGMAPGQGKDATKSVPG